VGVELRWGNNVVVIDTASHGRQEFRVHDRSRTDNYRRSLREMYAALYYETGFDTGLMSRIKSW